MLTQEEWCHYQSIPPTSQIIEMIITTQNIRGLNSKGKQRYLKERLRKDKPSVMILQETKISELKLKEIVENIKPRFEIVGQDVIGSVGGFTILWNLKK